MNAIEHIVLSKIKPKEKQTRLVRALVTKEIPVKTFIAFFESASDVDRGVCADAMKHLSAESPHLLAPYIDVLVNYVNDSAPRVKWGVPEAIGNMSASYPAKAAKAIPSLLKNITDEPINTTVIKWCAAFALTEIARNNPKTRKRLLPVFERVIRRERNRGVRNVYAKAMTAMKTC